MQNFVISLKNSSHRREHILNEFNKHGVTFDFFDALTPDLALELANKISLNVTNSSLGGRELACFMSHVAIWQKVIQEKIPYVAVFEDDIYLGQNSAHFLNNFSWIHGGWNIIKIEAFAKKVWVGKEKLVIDNSDRYLKYLNGDNLGTAGYILSYDGAKEYLAYVLSNPVCPLDEMLFYKFPRKNKNKVLQMCPALCIQEMNLYPEISVMSSTIVEERRARMKKNKKTGIQKVKHEMVRIYEHIMKVFYAEEIKFK
ncbi:glycosyltransferase family 25 protein [Acinetobacter faecalis]|uniref:Glycosyltransferase family 25 protein n=1 Tax=Acinetobacter faecalis TaxID=2665161 RepID=A0AB35UT82_9GAMM|nr:glycosyltransferase family 25 protein [Acinetobacter faecalis]MDY6485769.1 glycosyltransferase family 25 protein [Acinetobacter faecalis]